MAEGLPGRGPRSNEARPTSASASPSTTFDAARMLAARVEELERALLCSPVRDSQGDFSSWAAQRLSRSVLRPLRDALRRLGAGREDPDANPDANPDASAGLSATREGVAPSIAGLDPVASPLDQRLWQLAEAATTLRI